MKKIASVLFCLTSLLGSSQGKSCYDAAFWKSCDESDIKIDSVKFDNRVTYFYHVEKMTAYRDLNGICQYNGTVIILNLKNNKLKNRKTIFKLINQKINLIEFNAYSDYKTFQLARSAYWSNDKEKKIKKGFLGTFKVK